MLIAGLLFVIFMTGMALRLHELDADSLWLDEIYTARRSQLDLPSLLALLVSGGETRGTQLPLMYVVTHFFIVIFNDGEFILRLQAMLFGSLAILMVYKVGEILWTREVGVTGAFLLAVNAYHVQYSQEARPYALMIFLALLSLVFLLKALRANKIRFWLGFTICTSLSLYNHYFAFLFLPAEIVFAAWLISDESLGLRRQDECTAPNRRGRRLSIPANQALALFLSLTLVALSYAPWLTALESHVSMVTESATGTLLRTGSLQSSLRLLRATLIEFSGVSEVVVLLWVAMFALGLVSSDIKQIALVATWIVTPFLFLSVVQSDHFVGPRYVLFILPLYLLPITRGVTTLSRWLIGLSGSAGVDRHRLHVATSAILVMAFGAMGVAPLKDYYLWQKEDWRSAALYLADNMAQGDVMLADGKTLEGMGDAHWVELCLSYYLRSYDIADSTILRVGERLWQDEQIVSEDQGEVWAVLWRLQRPEAWETLHEITIVDFEDISVVRLREGSGTVLRDAAAMLEVMLRLLPQHDHPDIYLALADTHSYMRELEEAARADKTVLELDPSR